MTFPRRWMDDGAGKSPMRDVLRAGGDTMDPPEGAEDAVWLALAAKIGTAGVAAGVTAKAAATLSAQATATTTAASGTAATTSAALGGGIFKAILIGALGGVVAVTGFTVLEPATPPAPTSTAPVIAPAPTKDRVQPSAPLGPAREASRAPEPSSQPVAPSSGEPAAPPVSAPPPIVAPSGTDTSAAVVPPSSNGASSEVTVPGSPEDRERLLREEREVVNQARTALRGGDTAGAMRLLEQARQKFPGGALGQEREALAIETLAKSGAREAASTRAAAFIKAHPTSPHAARLQVFVLP